MQSVGLQAYLLVSAVLALVAAVISFALIRGRDFVGHEEPAPAAASPVPARA